MRKLTNWTRDVKNPKIFIFSHPCAFEIRPLRYMTLGWLGDALPKAKAYHRRGGTTLARGVRDARAAIVSTPQIGPVPPA